MVGLGRQRGPLGLSVLVVVVVSLCVGSWGRMLAEAEDTEVESSKASRASYVERMKAKIMGWSPKRKAFAEIYAVDVGHNVEMSSICPRHFNYRLDTPFKPQCWASYTPTLGNWIQVGTDDPQFWTDIIMQGRADYPSWVKEVQIAFSLDGKLWDYVKDGEVFAANSDQTTKITISLGVPVYARVIRIYPMTWQRYINMRFEAVYVDVN